MRVVSNIWRKMDWSRKIRVLYSWLVVRLANPPWVFKDEKEERLYLGYTRRQRYHAVPRMFAVAVLFQLYMVLVPGERDVSSHYCLTMGSFFGTILQIIFYWFFTESRICIAHYTWLAIWSELLLSAVRRVGDSYNELLGWAALLQYLFFTTMPFHYLTHIIFSIISMVGFLLVQYKNASTREERLPEDFGYQQAANFMILLSATVLGGIAYAVADRQQRKSFQETKRSLGDKLTIEQQSKEQERLLLSVLPEHVAVQMRKDLGLIDTQFKKIYMSRHENVSILYADIVGFTAISSTYSAQDLVAILNELFARFDRLSEKYQQLRIKILGDCYYCISGAPVERSDHAVLSVHMGLSMVKAIKYVQQTTNSPVDMRVGIHTGAVLAGVLGQRQWQFDVYSRDVELANKMESSGKAGRVHISEVTLGYLNNEFEVEPAYGEKREEMLRQAGIKTYFIVRALKPFQSGDEKCAQGGEVEGGVTGGAGGGGGAGETLLTLEASDSVSDLHDDDEDSVLSPPEENGSTEELKILKMLKEELVNRDDDKELAQATTLCLTFKAKDVEAGWIRRLDPCPQAAVVPPLVLLPPVIIISSFAVPPTFALNALYLALILETGLFNVLYYACYRYYAYKKKTMSPYWKLTCSLFNFAMFGAANIAPLIFCGAFETFLDDGFREDALSHAGARRCLHPSYYYQLGAGLACAALWVSPMGGWDRFALFLALIMSHIAPSIIYPALLTSRLDIDKYPYVNANCNETTQFYTEILLPYIAPIHQARHIVMLILGSIALLIFDRYSSSLERARHSRSERMHAQAEQAADLRRRNQALIHNVLPPHVASHFMGAKHNHRDLYSQSYAEVGVLFASMPNFSEFYSEETVNNQGLECLRFLNEVISDFDMLLEEAKFKDIIKIKTIGSTYMAASGLNPTRQMQPSDSVVVRWAHLACLVEFALELQRVLTAINEQSFNHFVLRLGVNHGPITAGVIGARKPHYDIWGNTVNVASRMESTGKAGCVQVTEETCHILKNFGYHFEQRGLVAVKGKGQLMTYYLQGKQDSATDSTPPAPADVAPTPTVLETENNTEAPSPSEALLSNGPTTTAAAAAPTIDSPQRQDDDANHLLLPSA